MEEQKGNTTREPSSIVNPFQKRGTDETARPRADAGAVARLRPAGQTGRQSRAPLEVAEGTRAHLQVQPEDAARIRRTADGSADGIYVFDDRDRRVGRR